MAAPNISIANGFFKPYLVSYSPQDSIMSYTIHPTGLDDLAEIGQIFHDSFATHPILHAIVADTPEDVGLEADTGMIKSLMSQDPKYGGHFYKLVDNTSGYNFPPLLSFADSSLSYLISQRSCSVLSIADSPCT